MRNRLALTAASLSARRVPRVFLPSQCNLDLFHSSTSRLIFRKGGNISTSNRRYSIDEPFVYFRARFEVSKNSRYSSFLRSSISPQTMTNRLILTSHSQRLFITPKRFTRFPLFEQVPEVGEVIITGFITKTNLASHHHHQNSNNVLQLRTTSPRLASSFGFLLWLFLLLRRPLLLLLRRLLLAQWYSSSPPSKPKALGATWSDGSEEKAVVPIKEP